MPPINNMNAEHNTASSNNEVNWQVAWMALVLLAIGAMTQPCGYVLDIDETNYRLYIRASPIVFIADVLHFLVRVFLGFSLDYREFWYHIKAMIRYRFREEHGIYGLVGAEKASIIRWALLVIGSIPCQTINLMAMQGIPGRKPGHLCSSSPSFWEKYLFLLLREFTVLAKFSNTNSSHQLPEVY
ncbi:hypothetical protein VTN00DRAFT_9270 [Thermoascus crustaceus]|uniref:uncharacterized protein n=1 Tax=Thermoascus crustaceus TaxID=5088 RepID=UPI003742EF0B